MSFLIGNIRRSVILIFISFSLFTYAQRSKNTNVWYFGDSAGVSFINGSPAVLNNGSLRTGEGCASICNNNGSLLFYTDGCTVWNKNNVPMANGTGLHGNWTSTQSAIIVPKPDDDSTFYIFTVENYLGTNGLQYSIVDLKQNNFLGKVISKNVSLLNWFTHNTYITEKITAVKHRNGSDVWVIVHEWNSNKFYAFLLTNTGINSPAISSVGSNHSPPTSNVIGYMKASPDGKKLALAIHNSGIFEIFDFNDSSGAISNPISFSPYYSAYGVEFSADASKLYVSEMSSKFIYQIDLLAGSKTNIINSISYISTTSGTTAGAMQLGRDGKIYVAKENSNYLGVINNPSARGTDCSYLDNSLYLNNGTNILGLPNFITNYFYVPNFTFDNTCIDNPTNFHITNITNVDSVLWIFDDFSTGLLNYSSEFNPTHIFSNQGFYNVKLISFINGNHDTVNNSVFITPNPETGFIIDDSSQCLDSNKFAFIDTSSFNYGSLSYKWFFGDGNTIVTDSSVYSYSSSDTFSVMLVISSDNGCVDTLTKNVYVHSMPVVDFSINNSNQCLNNNNFIFINNSVSNIGFSSHNWSFGDGSSTTSLNTSHIYTTGGSFVITLIGTSNIGCQSSSDKNVFIHPVPKVNLKINDSSQCLYDNYFTFNNASTIDSGTFNTSFDFGDGGSNNNNPTFHIYSNEGSYIVKLISFSDRGCSDSTYKIVHINIKPSSGFNMNDSIQCYKENFIFKNNSTIDSGQLSFKWYFGNGDSSIDYSPVYQYSTGSHYKVTLIATSDKGCTDTMVKSAYIQPNPKADFSINDSSQCLYINKFHIIDNSIINSGAINYLWYFGDGYTSTYKHNIHTYFQVDTFKIKLVVSSDKNCKDSLTRSIIVHPKPMVDFDINDYYQCVSSNYFVFNNNSHIQYGNLSYKWSFGDSSFGNKFNQYRVFSSSGKFEIKLITTSDMGCVDSISKYVYLHPKPIVDFSINDSSQCLDNNLFKFVNHSSIPFGNLYSKWSFGDGKISLTKNTNYSYSADKEFNVKLNIVTEYGCQDSLIKTVEVNPLPSADFTFSKTCIDEPVYFYDKSTIKSKELISEWNWKFGSNNFSTQNTPSFVFNNPGEYLIELNVTSTKGCIDQTLKILKVNDLIGPSTITRATVSSDKNILVEWDPPVDRTPISYLIEKSVDGINFNSIDSFDNQTFSYIDKDVNINEESYYYRLKTMDSCNDFSSYSNVGKTIVLSVDPSYDENTASDQIISWTKYQGWAHGVQHYEIQLKDIYSNTFKTIDYINVDSLYYKYVGPTINQSGNCFRIIAHKKTDVIESISNEVCFNNPFNLWIPNCFSPNKDSINDWFEVKGVNIVELRISIFNKWGEEIFSSNDIHFKWDGKVKEKDCPTGHYFYIISARGTGTQRNYAKGRIFLIR